MWNRFGLRDLSASLERDFMALVILCAAGFGLGVSFNLFALLAALATISSLALLTSAQVGLAGGILNAVGVSVSLQVGYMAGIAARRLIEPRLGVQIARLLPRPRRR